MKFALGFMFTLVAATTFAQSGTYIVNGPPTVHGLTMRPWQVSPTLTLSETLTLADPLMKVEPTKRVVFGDEADGNTVVCWKGQCKRLLEIWPPMQGVQWGNTILTPVSDWIATDVVGDPPGGTIVAKPKEKQ
jgi:hypothetical protein